MSASELDGLLEDHVRPMAAYKAFAKAFSAKLDANEMRAIVEDCEAVPVPFNLSSLSQAVAALALTALWPVVEQHVQAICASARAL